MIDELRLQTAVSEWKSKASSKSVARILVWGDSKPPAPGLLGGVGAWAWKDTKDAKKAVCQMSGKSGPTWLVRPALMSAEEAEGVLGWLNYSAFAQGRDGVGQAVVQALDSKVGRIEVRFEKCSEETVKGGLVGIQMAGYDFKRIEDEKLLSATIKVVVGKKPVAKAQWEEAFQLGSAVNLARQLTNLPPNRLNPVTYSQAIKQLFKGLCEVEIWGPERLKKEKMNQMLAVGGASDAPPQLVHLKYRPKLAKGKKSIAFVGKGITFDTGGLDLKPDTAMRWMKKDMGGSAAVVGLAWWAVHAKIDQPCDFYLALAENSVGSRAFRPGDIIKTRNGQTVEIHNTDAEGRLVLADAMSVAVEDKPEVIVDVATLTGAIKVGLGAQVAGLFGNNDAVLKEIIASAQSSGDWVWPMPLFRKYKSGLKSSFANFVNAGDGFGGAITAALYLENFVGKIPWVHLDIYAWKDGAEGAIGATGGNGQAVQLLANWLMSRNDKHPPTP